MGARAVIMDGSMRRNRKTVKWDFGCAVIEGVSFAPKGDIAIMKE